MELAVICFTRKGSSCCRKLVAGFRSQGLRCIGYIPKQYLREGEDGQEQAALIPLTETLQEWTKARFEDCIGIIFVGAAGIAVRAIAPWLRDKKTDPAVVAADERAAFCISLLSGHVGGANRLAEQAAAILGAVPVITTATDIEGKIAIDVLAQEAGLRIADWELAKQVSAELLEGRPVGFFSEYQWPEEIPDGFTASGRGAVLVWVSARIEPPAGGAMAQHKLSGSRVLRLVPPVFVAGIGCRRGTAAAVIRRALMDVMEHCNLAWEGIAALASIDLKQEEAGLLALAEELKAGFFTFTREQLQCMEGDFTASDFVRQITGVDNVCERAALAGGGAQARLLIRKQTVSGVTIAIAEKPWMVRRENSIWQKL